MSLVVLESGALLAELLFDCNPSVGVAAHDLEQLALRVVRKSPLCPQVLLHGGERDVALLE